MIRKPSEQDFRESTAVTVVRESRKIAVEGSKGVASGIGRTIVMVQGCILAFGLIVSAIPFIAGSRWIWVLAIVAFFAVRYNRKAMVQGKREGAAQIGTAWSAAPVGPPSTAHEIRYDYDITTLMRQSVSIALPGVLLFFAGSVFTPILIPLRVASLIMMALAFILVARLFRNRTAVAFDAESIVVKGLRGESRMLWLDVQDVYAHKFSFFDLKTLFSVGTRRTIVVEALRNRLGGPSRLVIPMPLLGLDQEQEATLIARLLQRRAGGGEAVPVPRTSAAWAPREPKVGPAGDPRASFDPVAIRARRKAEREQIIAANRPDLRPPQGARKMFGRKAS